MVGERMYALQTSDNVVLAALHQQAGRNVGVHLSFWNVLPFKCDVLR
jgi:hypothetical protein